MPKKLDIKIANAIEIACLDAAFQNKYNPHGDPGEGGFVWSSFSSKTPSEDMAMSEETVKEDIKELVSALDFKLTRDRTLIVVIAVDRSGKLNVPQPVSCRYGKSLGGYAYDQKSDSYLVECAATKELGWISRSFVVTLPNCGNWRTNVPLSTALIDRYLSGAQRRMLKDFSEKFPAGNFEHHYIQMQGCSE